MLRGPVLVLPWFPGPECVEPDESISCLKGSNVQTSLADLGKITPTNCLCQIDHPIPANRLNDCLQVWNASQSLLASAIDRDGRSVRSGGVRR